MDQSRAISPYLLLLLVSFVGVFAGQSPAAVLLIGRPGPGGPAGFLAAQQIAHWPVSGPLTILDHEPDQLAPGTTLIIDLTEDFDFRAEMPMANGSVIRVSAPPAELNTTLNMAHAAADAINAEVQSPTEKFIVETVPPASSPSPSVARITVITATINELERQRISLRTREDRIAVHAILSDLHLIDASVTSQRIAADRRPGMLRVAIFDDHGAQNSTAHHPVWIQQSMRDQKDMDVYLVNSEDIRAGALPGQFDVLVMGGGRSREEGATLEDAGKEALKDYVDHGGGYVGICAGAFLASRNPRGLGISPTTTKTTGADGDTTMHLTDAAAAAAGLTQTDVHAAFHGGPRLALADDAQQFGAEIWSTFTADLVVDSRETADDASTPVKSEKADTAKTRIIPLKDTPAVVAAHFGQGHVVIFAPHCERAPGPQTLFWSAVRWAATGQAPKATAGVAVSQAAANREASN